MTERKWSRYTKKVVSKKSQVHITREEIRNGVDKFLANGGKIKRDPIIQKVIDGEWIDDYSETIIPLSPANPLLVTERVPMFQPELIPDKKFSKYTDNAILTEEEASDFIGINQPELAELRSKEIGNDPVLFITIADIIYYKFKEVKNIKRRMGGIIAHKKRCKSQAKKGLISEITAAAYLGIPYHTLSNSRRGRNRIKPPPYIKKGPFIYYKKTDLKKFKRDNYEK